MENWTVFSSQDGIFWPSLRDINPIFLFKSPSHQTPELNFNQISKVKFMQQNLFAKRMTEMFALNYVLRVLTKSLV